MEQEPALLNIQRNFFSVSILYEHEEISRVILNEAERLNYYVQ